MIADLEGLPSDTVDGKKAKASSRQNLIRISSKLLALESGKGVRSVYSYQLMGVTSDVSFTPE